MTEVNKRKTAAASPVEIYSKARLAELAKSDAGLSPYTARIKVALRGKTGRK